MAPERKSIGIKTADFSNDDVWNGISKTFINNPEAVQEIKFTDGPLSGQGFLMTMHQESDGSGYLQIDHVTNFSLETIFMNYCMEKGTVEVGGVYRFPFDSVKDATFLKS